MNRAWLLWGATVIGSSVWIACGGTTELPPSGNAGVAGMAGSSGSGGGGFSGSAAGAGGSAGLGGAGGAVASWAACSVPGTCVKDYEGCCAPCGKETFESTVGVRRDAIDQYHLAECGTTTPACPMCPIQMDPNLTAFCVSGRCEAVDVRTDPVSSCVSDSDCTLRFPDCCNCAADPSMLIALRADSLSQYTKQICDPASDCPPCAGGIPPGYVAYCGPSNHCIVGQVQTPGACPAQLPNDSTSCWAEGQHCEYGSDIRMNCRANAWCKAGTWSVPSPMACPNLPPAGWDGCPKDMGASLLDCKGLDGTVCDMLTGGGGDGSMCVCDTCAGGPCSYPPHWYCVAPQPGCPAHAPNTGQSCSSEGQTCIYGACGTVTSAGRSCKQGIWHDEPVACPL